MNDAPPRSHPVYLSRLNYLDISQAFPVHNRPGKKISYRGKTDMGMRANFQRSPVDELQRPKPIEKNKRTHCPALRRGQGALHVETSDITPPWNDHSVDGLTVAVSDALRIIR